MHNDKQFFNYTLILASKTCSSAGEIDHASLRESIRRNKVFTLVTQTRLKQIQFLASMFSAFCEAKFIEILFFRYKKAETQTYE